MADQRFASFDDDELDVFKRKLDAAQSGARHAHDDVDARMDDPQTLSNLEQCATYLTALHEDVIDEIDRRARETGK